jgi:hypothetical protein
MDIVPAYVYLPLSQEPLFQSTLRFLDVGDMKLRPTRWSISYTPHASDNRNRDRRRWSVLCVLSELRSSADLPPSLYTRLHMGIHRLSLPKSLSLLKLTALHFYFVISIHLCSIIFHSKNEPGSAGTYKSGPRHEEEGIRMSFMRYYFSVTIRQGHTEPLDHVLCELLPKVKDCCRSRTKKSIGWYLSPS